jgi:hypothetical protein
MLTAITVSWPSFSVELALAAVITFVSLLFAQLLMSSKSKKSNKTEDMDRNEAVQMLLDRSRSSIADGDKDDALAALLVCQ